jgi:DNA-binding beta-propeller fold protein YncE
VASRSGPRPAAVALFALVMAGCGHTPPGTARAQVILMAGGGSAGDGARASEARLEEPFAVAVDPLTGETYFSEYQGNRIRKIDRAGTVTTVVGRGAPGAAGAVVLTHPHHLAFPPRGGDLFIADTSNSRIFRYQPATATVTRFGPQLALGRPHCLAFDPSGRRLYVAETQDGVIRSIDIETLAVSSLRGPFSDARAVAVDSKGNVYVLSRKGNSLSVIDPAGKAARVAGTGQSGYSGDGGAPLRATMNGPKHLTVDSHDDVLIADTENHVIRKVLVRQNLIVTVAGTGVEGSGTLPGSASAVSLARPHGVLQTADGAIIISDSGNNRLLRLQ